MRLGGRGSQTSGLDTMGDLVEIMRIGGHHSLLIAACCEGGRGGLEMGPRPSLIVISEETRGAQARGRDAQGTRESRYAASHRTDPIGMPCFA